MHTLKRFIVTVLMLLATAVGAADKVYTFGVVPQQSASELARSWGPLLNQVSVISGVKLRFATAPDIPTFERRLAEGVYDFAYMNPYHFTVFNKSPGYQAMAKESGRLLKGIVVAKKYGAVKTLAALNGQSMAFPAPAAFAATILPRAELRSEGIKLKANYLSSHDSVYLAVVKGIYPAGGGIQRTLEMIDPAIRDQLQVIWSTKGYTPHAIASHPKVEAQVTQSVLNALLALNKDPAGKALFAEVGFNKGVSVAANQDWDDVRRLRIDLLGELIEK
jgi:phosphonate transport system substrate-binding protein